MNNYTTGAFNMFFYGLLNPINVSANWINGAIRMAWSEIYEPDVNMEIWTSNNNAPFILSCISAKGAPGADVYVNWNYATSIKIRAFKDGAYSGFAGTLIVAADAGHTGVNYFVRSDGNDALDGLTNANAWQTMAKVHSISFTPGDNILFRRGDAFRGSFDQTENGTVANRITYGAYSITGSLDKPKLLGSKDLSSPADWVIDAGNVWKTAVSLGAAQNDISNLVFNNETSFGMKKLLKASCIAQGDFWFNYSADDCVYIYSVRNPATFYTNIEACGNYGVGQGICYWRTCTYITVQGLDFRYSSAAGIEFRDCSQMIIEYNDLSWVGGEYLANDGVDPTRLGNGISLWMSNSYFEIRYNKINQCYDAGISPQGSGAYTINNINIYYNQISNTQYSYELWTDVGQTLNEINFYNNTCYNAGYSFSYTQRADFNECHVMIWSLNGVNTNIRFRNNVFGRARNRGIRIWENVYAGLTFNNNLYNVPQIAYTTAGVFTTLAQWQTETGQEAQSVSGDPQFKDAGSDYHLTGGSISINIGANLSLTKDIEGVAVDSTPNAGCYETVN